MPQTRFSDASFYPWRRWFGGIDVPDAKRLRVLEAESAKLKKLLAEAMLDAGVAGGGAGKILTSAYIGCIGKLVWRTFNVIDDCARDALAIEIEIDEA